MAVKSQKQTDGKIKLFDDSLDVAAAVAEIQEELKRKDPGWTPIVPIPRR